MVRKCPTLLCHWRLAQNKEKSKLWSWLILGTRPPEACPPASCGQCYTQVITHLDKKSAFRHLETLTSHSSYLWASRAGPDPLLQVPISENKVSYLLHSDSSCRCRSVQGYQDALQHTAGAQEDWSGTSTGLCNPMKFNWKMTELHDYAELLSKLFSTMFTFLSWWQQLLSIC